MSGALTKAVQSFERADTELRRASQTMEQPRLQRAGNRYAIAKIKMFRLAREADGTKSS